MVVEEVPWGNGKHQLTNVYMLFLARSARRLSWKETAEALGIGVRTVTREWSMAKAWLYGELQPKGQPG